MRRLILGSSSKPRQLLLQRLGLAFEQANPDIDETPRNNESAEQLVRRLAPEKAWALSDRFPDALIIGADQVAVIDGEIFGKPLNHQNAIEQLQKMSGQEIKFLTGLCLFDSRNQTQQVAVEHYRVKFRRLSLASIESYLQKEGVLNCAGSFKVEGLGISLVETLHGNDYTALIGLPLIQLTKMLEAFGLSPLSS